MFMFPSNMFISFFISAHSIFIISWKLNLLFPYSFCTSGVNSFDILTILQSCTCIYQQYCFSQDIFFILEVIPVICIILLSNPCNLKILFCKQLKICKLRRYILKINSVQCIKKCIFSYILFLKGFNQGKRCSLEEN